MESSRKYIRKALGASFLLLITSLVCFPNNALALAPDPCLFEKSSKWMACSQSAADGEKCHNNPCEKRDYICAARQSKVCIAAIQSGLACMDAIQAVYECVKNQFDLKLKEAQTQ